MNGFKEEEHPRGGEGTKEGGQFVAKGATGTPVEEKRGRGRPRKHPLPDPNVPKRPRGRPRKYPVAFGTVAGELMPPLRMKDVLGDRAGGTDFESRIDAILARPEFSSSVPSESGVVKAREQRFSEEVMQSLIAELIEGRATTNREVDDIDVGGHAIEVKVKLTSKKDDIRIGRAAMARKEEALRAGRFKSFSVVVIDLRDKWDGGFWSDRYSRHRIYYTRRLGNPSLSSMLKLSDIRGIMDAIAMSDDSLPEKARAE